MSRTPTPEALPPLPAETPAEKWLRSKYGAYRGHFAWRELQEAFTAGRASIAMGEGEPVAEVVWYDPQLDRFPRKDGHKIIDASMAFMDSAPLGTKLYTAQPAPAAPVGDDRTHLPPALQSRQPDVPVAPTWNSIQIASWIGSQLMHDPAMFERAAVCKFVRSLGRHPTLQKHSPVASVASVSDDLRTLGKWLNEELISPIDRPALARVLHTLSLRPAPAQPMSDALSELQWIRKHFRRATEISPEAVDIVNMQGHEVIKWMGRVDARLAADSGAVSQPMTLGQLRDVCKRAAAAANAKPGLSETDTLLTNVARFTEQFHKIGITAQAGEAKK